MSKSEHARRIFILTIVGAFVLSSIGFTGLVIWEATKSKDQKSKTADIQKKLEEELKNQQNKEEKLEGTKLQAFDPVSSVSELQKIDIKEGTGAVVKAGDTVTAHYTGAVASTGVIFQSSYDSGNPVPFGLGQVIKGWTEGVPGMKEGGTRRLIIPAEKAYGANPPGGSNIPPNADLVFDIVLVKIGQ